MPSIFPVHGDTNVDSHLNPPFKILISEDWTALKNILSKIAIGSGLIGMMIAHLNIPALDSTKNLPSALSNPIINGLLKQQLKFKGLIVFDD